MMAKLDYKYLDGILEKAQAGDGNAFAEIYTATYDMQYHMICQDTQDTKLALELLLQLYTSAFMDIHSLNSSKHLLLWLNQIRCKICTEFCKTLQNNPQTNISSPYKENDLDSFLANQILTNALAVCKITPSSVPVDVLKTWKNYTKPAIYRVRYFIYSMLGILIFLPLLFVKPSIKVEWIGSGAKNSEYILSIHSILPVSAISAELNEIPKNLMKTGYRKYKTQVDENGTLTITIKCINGQTYTRAYTLTPFDTEPPIILSSDRRNGYIFLTIQETYSGINYQGITGLTPKSYDAQSGQIIFREPDSEVIVNIPDNAGNTLSIHLSP